MGRSKRTPSAGAAPRADARRSRRQTQTAGREAQASRAARLEIIRSGTPSLVMRALGIATAEEDDLEGSCEDEGRDREAFASETDPDIDLSDEDLVMDDVWEPRSSMADVVIPVEGDSQDELRALWTNTFQIVVTKDTCAAFVPPWVYGYEPKSPTEEDTFSELLVRLHTYDAIAGWLTGSRSPFLVSRDLWDLGPNTFEELLDRRPTVVQKSFLDTLGLARQIAQSTFSRYLDSCCLAWPDGAAPLRVLFCQEARHAWVARAVVLFADHHGEHISRDMLASYAKLTVRRGRTARQSLLRGDVSSMDLPTFIELANLLCGTAWRNVTEVYGARMITSDASHTES